MHFHLGDLKTNIFLPKDNLHVEWFKDDLPINSPDYLTKVEGSRATLTIEETFSEDSARYTCRVTAAGGVAESSGCLRVLELHHRQYEAPDFVRHIRAAELLEGEPLVLECQVTGMPSPEVFWAKDDESIENCPDYILTRINGTCTLRVKEGERVLFAVIKC